MSEMKRPILRYHGGKWRIANWVISHMPAHRVYVEPFCGAASILMRKPRVPAEVINDLNGRLINVFRVLRDPKQSKELMHAVKYTPYSRSEYIQARVPSDESVEDARRMIILGQQGFGSTGPCGGKLAGWRSDVKKDRDHSSADNWANVYNQIEIWANRLRSVFIENSPAIDILKRWDSTEALFYVDPPYVASTRQGSGDRGYAHELTNQDHVDLAKQLHEVKGMVMLSGYNCDLYDELYKGWEKVERGAMADGGKKTTECLWISPEGHKGQFSFKESGFLF